MNINLRTAIDDEIEWHVQNFISLGWVQEDISYLTKNIGIVTNPDSKNEEWKTSIGFVLYPELLEYTVRENVDGKRRIEPTTCPWICGRITMTKDENEKYQIYSKRVNEVAEYMKEELKKLPIKPFYDEDAFHGVFSRPKDKLNGFIEFSFYINKDYPKGY